MTERTDIPQVIDLKIGQTVEDVLDQNFPTYLRDHLVVFNKGQQILEPQNYYVNTNDRLSIYVVPQGGGGGSKSLISIVIGVALIATAAL